MERARWLLMAAPSLLFLALHLPALDYEFVWTDQGEIVQGTLIRPSGASWRALLEPMHSDVVGGAQPYYRPLHVVVVNSIHTVEGKDPRGFRAVSLGIGSLTMLLFTVFAWMLLRARGPAILAGLIAAAHPAGIEVYVWIAGLSEALADLLVVASLMGALQLARASHRAARLLWFVSSFVAASLAVLSKENGGVAPLLLAGLLVSLAFGPQLHAAPGSAERLRFLLRRLGLLLLAELALAAIVLGPWRRLVLGGLGGGASWIGDSLTTQWFSAIALWPRLFGWLVAPLVSTTSDTVRIVDSPADPALALGVVLVVGSAAAWAWLLRRGHTVAAFGLLWIWIAHLPTSGLLPALHMRGERYLHLSLFGFALVAGSVAAVWLDGRPSARRRAAIAALGLAFVAGLAQRTWVRQPDWRNEQSLFARDLERDPGYREGRYELARAQFEAGDLHRAWETLADLIEAGDRAGTTGYLRESDAFALYCHVGLRLDRSAAVRSRLDRLERESRSVARDPALRFCHGHALELSGHSDRAAAVYEDLVLSQGPAASPELRIALARTLVRMRRKAEAAKWLAGLPADAELNARERAEARRLRRHLERTPR
jgi:hypothetical protein